MPASDPARRALYTRLEEVLGHEHAETLMTHLPPHEAESLATKADVQVIEARFDRLEARFDGMDERFYGLQETLRDQLRSYTLTTIWSMTALTGIFSAIVVILR